MFTMFVYHKFKKIFDDYEKKANTYSMVLGQFNA